MLVLQAGVSAPNPSRVSKIVVQFVPGVNYVFVRCNGFGSFRLQLPLPLPAALVVVVVAAVDS